MYCTISWQWQWANGDPVNYTAWTSGQPIVSFNSVGYLNAALGSWVSDINALTLHQYVLEVPVPLTITAPNGGESFTPGTTQTISWTGSGIIGNVRIEFNANYPTGSWETLFANTPNDGSEVWTVPSYGTSNARIRITSISFPSVADNSDESFSIVYPTSINENFEGNYLPSGWRSTGSWERYAYSGNQSARSLNQTDTLFLPAVHLSGGPTAIINFRSSYSYAESEQYWNFPSLDTCTLIARSNNGSWLPVWMQGCSELTNRTPSPYHSDPDPFRNNTTYFQIPNQDALVQFAFATYATLPAYTDWLYLDDIQVFVPNASQQPPPAIQLTSPCWWNEYYSGDYLPFYWTSINVPENVNIEVNRSYPSGPWEMVLANTPNDGFENLVLTGPTTNIAKLRISSVSNPSVYAMANGGFSIQSRLDLTSLNGPQIIYNGDLVPINWGTWNFSDNLKIEINRDYPSGTWETLFANTPCDGTETWTVTGAVSTNARIRISSVDRPNIYDVSEGSFTIVDRYVQLTSPNGNETLFVGDTIPVNWNANFTRGDIQIELNRNYPTGTWESISASTPNDGSESWVVTGASTSNARIRVSSIDYPTFTDLSDASFSISMRSLSLTSPNGNESLFIGNIVPINWISSNVTGNVRMELNRDYPSGSWETLFASTPNDGSESWVVTGVVTTNARLRITSVDFPAILDITDASFSINPAIPSVTGFVPLGSFSGHYYYLSASPNNINVGSRCLRCRRRVCGVYRINRRE